MKIALVSPYDWEVSGGVNNHIHHLAEQFVSLGHQPHIVAPGAKPARPDVCPISTIGRPIPLRVSGSIARITLSLRVAGRIRRLLEEQEFDIVHVHEPFMPLLPFQFIRYSQATNVATFHAAREGGSRLYAYSRFIIRPWWRSSCRAFLPTWSAEGHAAGWTGTSLTPSESFRVS